MPMSLTLSKSLFFFLFLFTPLAFGTTEPWSYAIMETGTALAVVFFFVSVVKNNTRVVQVPGIFPLVFFLVYILFQLVPLPPALVQWLSPAAFDIHSTTAQLTDTSGWMPLTVNFKATVSEFFRIATYALFYILTVQLLRKRGLLLATVIVIAVFGGLLAFSSILQFYLTQDMALWFRHSPINSIVMGPYANHNHYAGLMELIFPIVLGLFLFYRPRMGNTSLIKGIAEILSQEKANVHILIGTAALLILISIFVSLSRGAMISTCLSLVVFSFFLLRMKINRGNTLLILVIIILTTLSIGWFGWDQIFERFARLKNAQGIIYESRLDFWKDTREIIRHYRLTGSGLGTFAHVYPLYRSVTGERFLSHAHNDYLELLAEGGIIGSGLALCFLFTVFYKSFRVFSKRRDAFSIYLYIGSITAMVSLLLHSVTDFNLHIGANGLWFFFVAGIAVSAAHTGMRQQSLETRLVPVSPLTEKSCAFLVFCALAPFIFVYNFSNLAGIFYYSNIKNYGMNTQTPLETIRKIEKVARFAARFDPLTAVYPFTRANAAWFSGNIETSKSLFIAALGLDPLNSRHLNRLGTFLAQQADPAKAGLDFKKSMIYDKTNAEYTFHYATWLFAKKEDKQGLDHMNQTLTLSETYFDRVMTAMIVSGIPDTDMAAALPDLPGPSIAYASFLSRNGRGHEAIARYLATLDLIETFFHQTAFNEKKHVQTTRSYYFKILRFFTARNDMKNAMDVMQRAEKLLPMDARIKVALGDLYFQQGISYKALDKYDHALLLDPGNKRALKMMKKINP